MIEVSKKDRYPVPTQVKHRVRWTTLKGLFLYYTTACLAEIFTSVRGSSPWYNCSASGMFVMSSFVNTLQKYLFKQFAMSVLLTNSVLLSSLKGPTDSLLFVTPLMVLVTFHLLAVPPRNNNCMRVIKK